MHRCQACQKLKHCASCSLQNKSPRLARPFACGLNSRLNPVARSSRQNTLFGKIWLFTFLLTLLYIYPYTHDLKKASRENFERETLEKTRLTHPQFFLWVFWRLALATCWRLTPVAKNACLAKTGLVFKPF